MLLYGGLLSSRLHHLTEDILEEHLDVLQELKTLNPHLKIYAFQCIMRCPQYNSSEEEPDYYEDYGYALFKKKYLEDKEERETLTSEEEIEKNRVRNAYKQNGCTVTVKEKKEQDNANSIKSIESKIEENPKNGKELAKTTGAIDFRESVRVKTLNGQQSTTNSQRVSTSINVETLNEQPTVIDTSEPTK